MDNNEKFNIIAQHTKGKEVEAQENYKFQSKRRLQKVVETKINTTMIGAISVVEEKFGNLWGRGKAKHQLNEQELSWLELKDELRTEILNNGNNQKRAAVAEINQYDVSWKRHHMEMHIQERQEQEKRMD